MEKKRSEKIFIPGFLFIVFAFFVFFPAPGNAQDVNISVSASVKSTSTPPIPPDEPQPPTDGSYIPPETEVVFRGKAFPSALVTILKNGSVIASFKADQYGNFERRASGMPGGIYNFGIFAEDTDGLKSETLNFSLAVIERRITTVSNIFVPSTISLFPQTVVEGEEVRAFGQTFPGSKIRIFISPSDFTKETTSTNQGKWSLQIETKSMSEGEYKVKSKSYFGEGEQSGFSKELPLKIVKKEKACNGADLNLDKKVDLVDFSILLYFWEQESPENRCADINSDKIVDIIDFSIMMYQWNG